MLATLPHLFHPDILLSGYNAATVYTGTIFGNLLASYEQFHVQSNYILLDEFKVEIQFLYPIYALQ